MKKILFLPVLISSSLILSTKIIAQKHQLTKLWQTDTTLKVPESVLFNAPGKFLFVSNIDGDPSAKDGKGSIGKVGLNGKIIKTDWVSGLNAPKGMGLYKNKLYVADVDNVVVIDVAKESITKRIPVEAAVFLNDLTIDSKGTVYVSDSRTGKVHVIENDKVSTYADGLKGPNGVLAVGTDLYVLASGTLLKITADKKTIKIAEGMEAATDGLEQVNAKDFIVSVWNGVIYYVKGDGTVQKMLDTKEQKINSADIGYDAKNKIVYVPTFFKNGIVAYQLK
jgi:hypothetical protein